jgi:hypothetical protein
VALVKSFRTRESLMSKVSAIAAGTTPRAWSASACVLMVSLVLRRRLPLLSASSAAVEVNP